MSHDFRIKDGAIFVADVHYAPYRTQFLGFLKELIAKKPSQLFLLGDIFDFLSSQISYSIAQNMALIDEINRASKTIEIFYFEGNHDFNLKNLFPNVTIFSRKEQPAIFFYDSQKIAISHGDIYSNWLHEIYFFCVSKKELLKLLELVDTRLLQNKASKMLYRWLEKKKICKSIDINKKLILKRIKNYLECDQIIEGHFHTKLDLSVDKKRYIAISAFACNRSSFVVESLNKQFKLKEVIL